MPHHHPHPAKDESHIIRQKEKDDVTVIAVSGVGWTCLCC